MWITGGLCPDHASIGRFIQQHDGHMSGEFLPGLTRSVLRVTASGVETVAGDGTVVQAAASRYRTLKQEAARAAAEEARQAAQANPGDAKLQAHATQAEQVEATLAQRAAAQAKVKPSASLSISPVEPEAVIQPQRTKRPSPPPTSPASSPTPRGSSSAGHRPLQRDRRCGPHARSGRAPRAHRERPLRCRLPHRRHPRDDRPTRHRITLS